MKKSASVLVRKEFRALVPLWSACAAAVCGAGVARQIVDDPTPTLFFTLTSVSMLAFAVGSIALGAQSIGHEYTHRTLPILLSQPRARRVLLGAKIGVLTPMIITLSVLAWWFLFRDPASLRGPWRDFPAPILVAACALFLAPWLTMISRSTMAAIVFTFAIPPCLLVAGDLIGVWRYGMGAGAPIDRFKFGLFSWGTLCLCAAAAVAGWRTFMHLEALESTGRHLELPELRASAATRKRSHRILLLVKKELRLQQLTFVLVAIYGVVVAGIWVAGGVRSLVPVFEFLSVLYAVLLCAVIGSLAFAEERQYGVHDVQRLLPIAIWKQWAIKVGVAVALAILVGFGVPVLVEILILGGDAHVLSAPPRRWVTLLIPIVLLTSGSLYVSSLSSSGVRAVVMSLPAFVAMVVFVNTVEVTMRSRTAARVLAQILSAIPFDVSERALRLTVAWTPSALAAAMTTLLLWFAFRNNQSGERSASRVVKQLLCIAAVIVVALSLEVAVRMAFR